MNRSIIVLLFGALACQPGESIEETSLEHTIDTIAGIERVVSRGTAPTWRLEPVVSVGSEGGIGEPAPDEFGRVVAVTTDADGNLFVADRDYLEIRVFDRSGNLIRQIGRQGGGPGEFENIYSMAWIDTVLLVLDFRLGRIAELSGEGEWLGSRPTPGRISGSPSLLRLFQASRDVVYQWSLGNDGGRVWVEHGIDGITAERPQHNLDRPEPTGLMCALPNGGISFFDTPFGPRMFEHPTVGGSVMIAWSARYAIASVASNGDTVRVIEREREPVPISNAEWENATREFADFKDEWPGAECEPRGFARPEFKHAFTNLLLDVDGRLWVEAVTPSGTEWDVFGTDGRLIGTVPGFDYDRSLAPSLNGDDIAWISRDSLGVQRVHLARLFEVGEG
jgi:6-bladed beta-propeller